MKWRIWVKYSFIFYIPSFTMIIPSLISEIAQNWRKPEQPLIFKSKYLKFHDPSSFNNRDPGNYINTLRENVNKILLKTWIRHFSVRITQDPKQFRIFLNLYVFLFLSFLQSHQKLPDSYSTTSNFARFTISIAIEMCPELNPIRCTNYYLIMPI